MWSPQRYKDEGKKQGRTDELLENAITQSETLINSVYGLPSILSLSHLSMRTGVAFQTIRSYVNRGDHDAYGSFSIRKRSGGKRFIRVPSPNLMRVQRWINDHILARVPVHSASQAFKKGNSTYQCAAKHCGAQWLIKVDVADFFESISEIQVYRVFKELGYQPLVAFELARLCTIRSAWLSPRRQYKQWRVHKSNAEIADYSVDLLGYVPQGAPTSPLLSNLIMRDCDDEITGIAAKYKLTYTRYSDDLAMSTRSKDFDRRKARQVVNEIYRVLSRSGFRPQFRKTNIVPPGSKKIVLGLNVDGGMPRLQKEYRDRIRQHLYYLQKLGPSSHAAERGFDSIWGMKSHLKGMIDYANMIEPKYARVCLDKFKAVDWPI
ncbi:reverse transcriptase family protein [Hyphococcus sp.]|uniref:reverse transcriptase family protein n=1 Tax=Hyphococcus sp. TaxID=2038636 RepID=UPI003CCBCE61